MQPDCSEHTSMVNGLKNCGVWANKNKTQADHVYPMMINVKRIREGFQRSPCKSTDLRKSSTGNPANNCLACSWTAFNYEIGCDFFFAHLKPTDKLKRLVFSVFLQETMQDVNFTARLVFSDEPTFQLSGRAISFFDRIDNICLYFFAFIVLKSSTEFNYPHE